MRATDVLLLPFPAGNRPRAREMRLIADRDEGRFAAGFARLGAVEGRVEGEIGSGLLVLLGIAAGRRRGRRSAPGRQGRAAARVRERRGPSRPLAARHRRRGARRQPVHADRRHARREIARASRPRPRREHAEPLVESFCAALRELGVPVETGVFGARMEVELVNDGPVTIVLERLVVAAAVTGDARPRASPWLGAPSFA